MSELANQHFSNALGATLRGQKKLPRFSHKYIDGTDQQGRYINDQGKIFKIVDNGVPQLYDYPKDAGFVEKDGNGNYFYFEPLPDFKIKEIKRLEKERDDKLSAEKVEAKRKDHEKTQEEAKKKFESLAQAEAEKKSAPDKASSSDKAETETTAKQASSSDKAETTAKPSFFKTPLGLTVTILTGVLVIYGGVKLYKHFKK